MPSKTSDKTAQDGGAAMLSAASAVGGNEPSAARKSKAGTRLAAASAESEAPAVGTSAAESEAAAAGKSAVESEAPAAGKSRAARKSPADPEPAPKAAATDSEPANAGKPADDGKALAAREPTSAAGGQNPSRATGSSPGGQPASSRRPDAAGGSAATGSTSGGSAATGSTSGEPAAAGSTASGQAATSSTASGSSGASPVEAALAAASDEEDDETTLTDEISTEAAAKQAAAATGTLFAFPPAVHLSPQRLGQLQTEYLNRLRTLMSGEEDTPADRRFAGEAWREGLFGWAARLYLLNSEFMQKLADSVDGDAKARDRIRFATQQWVDAMSPANFLATNPEAQRKLLETRGESLVQGMRHLLEDIQRRRISHTDERVFEVGRNMATTPGDVVFQNELFQLIQYAPTTEQVGRRPLLMVPPCINKYYILDLQPANSLVAWAVSQGHTVFMLSWRNANASIAHLGWDDYLEDGIVRAMHAVRDIAEVDRINVLGFCVGGTLLSSAAAMLAGRGERIIESTTLLTTLLDFSDPGTLGIFIDENFVSYKERTIGKRGLMPGHELATTFTYLRPNDLVWNYVVSKYLKGEDPPPFDLLYWNADSTNLAGPMFCWYLRHTYLQNELRIPGRLQAKGVPLDLGAIKVPTYLYASREDHIVPWHGAYESTRLLSGPLRFTLGASGHIAGVINPPGPNKRSYWTAESLPEQADDWFESATEHRGSWWPDWGKWLEQYTGGMKPAPAHAGNARYKPIERAPGHYVKEKAE